MRTFICIVMCLISTNKFHKIAAQMKWKGDTAFFHIEEESIFSQFNPAQSYAAITTKQGLQGDCTWEMTVEMDFNPSINNYVSFFINENSSFKNTSNGYYLALGKSNDALQFFVRKDGKDSLMIGGTEKQLNSSLVEIDVKLTRLNDGTWQLFSKPFDDFEYKMVGSAVDVAFSTFYSFTIGCNYTKTRTDKFKFSNLKITGQSFLDTIPPKLIGLEVVDKNTLKLSFNETIVSNKYNFSINDNSTEITEVEVNSSSAFLKLKHELTGNKSYLIELQNIVDLEGNVMEYTIDSFIFIPFQLNTAFILNQHSIFASFSKSVQWDDVLQNISFNEIIPSEFQSVDKKGQKFIFTWDSAFQNNKFSPFSIYNLPAFEGNQWMDTLLKLAFHPLERGDIVITELMCDPTPPVYLPEAEYVELYNASDYDVSYSQFQCYINGKAFGLDRFKFLPPHSYLLVVDDNDLHSFSSGINITSTQSSFSLVNGGFEMAVTSGENVIDYLAYDPELIFPAFKSNGGWAAERKDLQALTSQKNWGASENKSGGTPGLENSIKEIIEDQEKPKVTYLILNADTSLSLLFSEPMDISFLDNINNFAITDAIIDSATALFPSHEEVQLSISTPIKQFKAYTLTIQPLPDLGGIFTDKNTFTFQLPEHPLPNDLVINEIMFDPLGGCAEYIELYNRSNKFIDLSRIILTEQDENGKLKKGTLLYDRPVLIAPSSFLIVTKDAQLFANCYIASDTFILAPAGFSPLNNEGQSIAIVTTSGDVIDLVTYSAKWHVPILSNVSGVALEKIHPDLPSNEISSWTSASSLSGYFTPGSKNSQLISKNETGPQIALAFENISPNNDGYQDGLILNIPDNFAGYSVSIQIFDADTRLITELCNHYFLGTQSTFHWNGFADNKISAGIYALRIRGVHPNGDTFEKMLPFAISFK